MKSKFQNLSFGSVAVLSKEQQKKVKGGAYGQTTGNGSTACIATVYCTSWDFSHTQIKYASGATCIQANSAISCGSWSSSPGPCTCTK